MTSPSQNPDLVISRLLHAPAAEVYRAFTDPDQLAQWFGPAGFSVPRDSIQIDLRVGGRQEFVMVSDSDATMTSPVAARYLEVVENELLVGTEDADSTDAPSETSTLRLEFRADGSDTWLTLTQGPFPANILALVKQGWEESFDKLDNLLDTPCGD